MPHTWKFFRTGELDQVALETGADLLDLENLDQKLWVALSCPLNSGLSIAPRTRTSTSARPFTFASCGAKSSMIEMLGK